MTPAGRMYPDPAALATRERELRMEDMRRRFEQFKGQRSSSLDGGAQDVAALSDNDNGPKGPSMIPGSRLPTPYDPNRMQDWLRKGTIPLTRPANTDTLRGGPLKDVLEADQHRYSDMPESLRQRMVADQKRQEMILRQSLIPVFWGHGMNLAGKRSSSNIEDRRNTLPRDADGGDEGAGYNARVDATTRIGRPDLAWKSHDLMSPDYGVEARGAGAMRNRAQMMGLSPYAAISPWSPEYDPEYAYQGKTPNYAQWVR